MGWGSGINYKGEEIGYLHEAVCGYEGCGAEIDKGLSYCCGDLEGVGGERGCGDYFCSEHLFYSFTDEDGKRSWEGQRCPSCAERIQAGGPDAINEVE